MCIRDRPYESFHVLFLDVKNRLIDSRELFRGTLSHTSVYPRESIRRFFTSRNSTWKDS